MRNKLGQFVKGNKEGFKKGHPNYLFKHTEKTKEKIRNGRIGNKNPNWKGGKNEYICKVCKKKFYRYERKEGKYIYCSSKCVNSCLDRKKKLIKSHLGKYGELSSNWQGGKKSLQRRIRDSFKYRQWRLDIFTRDDYLCQKCGQRGNKLEADHYPKKFSLILNGYKIKNIEQAFDYKELWNINNGRTLCLNCHNKIHNTKRK